MHLCLFAPSRSVLGLLLLVSPCAMFVCTHSHQSTERPLNMELVLLSISMTTVREMAHCSSDESCPPWLTDSHPNTESHFRSVTLLSVDGQRTFIETLWQICFCLKTSLKLHFLNFSECGPQIVSCSLIYGPLLIFFYCFLWFWQVLWCVCVLSQCNICYYILSVHLHFQFSSSCNKPPSSSSVLITRSKACFVYTCI